MIVNADLIHHALQCREPGWGTIFDHDLPEGVRSRQKFMGDVAGTPALILRIHFPAPTAGRIAARGDAFEFTFLD